jgi:hypothetical protein
MMKRHNGPMRLRHYEDPSAKQTAMPKSPSSLTTARRRFSERDR